MLLFKKELVVEMDKRYGLRTKSGPRNSINGWKYVKIKGDLGD